MTPNLDAVRCKDCEYKSCAVAVLSDEELRLLSGRHTELNVEKGEILFKENTLNSHIFYLRKGLAKIHTRTGPEREYILKIATSPTYLGLSTIFGNNVHQYSATAIESSSICCIDINVFKQLIHDNGQFAYEIIGIISKEELRDIRHYVNQAHKQIPGRLAGALIFFSEQVYHSPEFRLPLSRNELAALLGTSRESVIRTLANFRDDGLIELHRSRVKVLQPESLATINRAG